MSTEHEKQMTGYPSIDKPWLKYYSEEAINAPLPKCTMYQYIWENNREHLSDVALRYYGSKITYSNLFENIQQAARAFSAMGIGAGDIVTIMSMHTPEMIYSFYALNYLGAVANMVYMTLSEKEIVETLNNTDSKLFFVLEPALERAEAVRDKISVPIVVLGVADSMPPHMKLGYTLKARPKKHGFLRWRDFLARGKGGVTPPLSTDHATPAVIVYTSGTTGDAKGVVLNDDAFNVIADQAALSGKNYHRRETWLDMIPPFFGFGITMLQLTIAQGLVTTLWIDINFEKVAKEFARLKPNRFISGPPLVDPIMKRIHGDMSWMIDFSGGGESISPEKEKQINDFLLAHNSKARYTTAYGMSEFGSGVCSQQNHIYKQGSVGVPFQKVNVKVVDPESGREMNYNEIGELCFNAPNIMLGYYKRGKDTEKMIEIDAAGLHWLHTGDLGIVDEDGFVFIKGRLKRIYLTTSSKDNSTPNKLFPDRIEEFFEAQTFIHLCGVVVKEDPDRLNVPIAFVEMKREGNLTKEQAIITLTELSQKELPEHLRPVHIYILDSMPITASGKIDYRALENKANVGEG